MILVKVVLVWSLAYISMIYEIVNPNDTVDKVL